MYDYFSKISYLVIEANSHCNLACRYCNRSRLASEGLREPFRLTVEKFKMLCNQFQECPIDTIKFEGLSEPMLHPQFDQLSEILRNYFPTAHIIIATNLNYNLEKSPFIKTLQSVDTVYLSIDGTETIYEKSRPGSSWKKCLQSLHDIKKFVPAQIRNKKLHINFTISPDNYLEVPKIFQLKDEFQLASVRLNFAQNWDEDKKNNLIFDDQCLSFLKPYKESMKGVGGWSYKDCFWPFNGIVVDVFGDVRRCLLNTSHRPFGNIWKTPVRDIFNNNNELNNIRSNLKQDLAASGCEFCDYKCSSKLLQKYFDGAGNSSRPVVRDLYE